MGKKTKGKGWRLLKKGGVGWGRRGKKKKKEEGEEERKRTKEEKGRQSEIET